MLFELGVFIILLAGAYEWVDLLSDMRRGGGRDGRDGRRIAPRFDPMLWPPYEPYDVLVILGDETGGLRAQSLSRVSRHDIDVDRVSLKVRNTCLQGAALKDPCCICLEDPTTDTMVRYTRCGHAFCAACFEEWYRRVQRCPLCNTELAESAAPNPTPIPAPTQSA